MSAVKVVLLDSDSESGSELEAYYTATSDESFSGDEEFFALVHALSISEDQQPAAPATAPVPPSADEAPPADSTSYAISHNGQTRLTPHWSEASGSPGQVRAIQRRRKERVKKPFIVVFVGLKPGVYANWKAAQAHCSNVACAIVQGYVSWGAANTAFQYATDRDWVLTVQRDDTAVFLAKRRQLISKSALPRPGVFASNGLNQGLDREAWYCVYIGASPGLYRTQLECAWHTIGIPGTCYESWKSLAMAKSKFTIATEAGRVSVKTS